jgi:hypothetical protein
MIRPIIEDAEIKQRGALDAKTGKIGWAVIHPSNGAILVYTDTEAEARAYKEAINDIPRQLRAAGFEVK